MAPIHRPESRSLEELAALYKLEPGLRDLYVEGSVDQSLIEWFLGVQGIKPARVKRIEYVDIPAATLIERGLEDNNRGRLIVLASHLEAAFGNRFRAATCIVDGDFDHINSTIHRSQTLLLTDYTSIEMYFFNRDSINKLLKLALSSFPKKAEQVLAEITPVLQNLFLMRMANAKLGWGLNLPRYDKCCEVGQQGLEFDSTEYIDRCLQANNRAHEKPLFLEAIRFSKQRQVADPRLQIHGHDFINFLAWYVRQHKGYTAIRPNDVERSLFASAEVHQLMKEGLFQSISQRLSPSGS